MVSLRMLIIMEDCNHNYRNIQKKNNVLNPPTVYRDTYRVRALTSIGSPPWNARTIHTRTAYIYVYTVTHTTLRVNINIM